MAPDTSAGPGPGSASNEGSAAPAASSPTAQGQVATAKPVNALGLLFSVLWARLRGVFGART